MSESQSQELKPQESVPPKKRMSIGQKITRGLLAATIIGNLTISENSIPVGTDTPTPQAKIELKSNSSENITHVENRKNINDIEEFKQRMQERGIGKVNVGFSSGYGDKKSEFLYDSSYKPEEPLTREEMDVLEEAADKIKFCLSLVDELAITKAPRRLNADVGYMSGGISPQNEYRPDGHSFMLLIEDNFDMRSDQVPDFDSKIGIKNHKESLEKVFFHECGHIAAYELLRLMYPKDQYNRFVDSRKNPNWEVLSDKMNPLYEALAELEGWHKTPEFQKDNPEGYVYEKDVIDNRFLANSKLQDMIREQFAELFALYMMKSPLLTERENTFFGKIKHGFESDPQKFAEELAQNPMMLLEK